ncbi:MAG: hypothetical protein QNJ38_19695 [Prochloraceae cyanobacterium]|nr:hypothetical protein [Prochloraceae cyanobacterium]
MELKSKLLARDRGLYLYGTTPPRQGTSRQKCSEIAEKLRARLSELALDAINVYNIQDEVGRTQNPRPFPFLPTIDARAYAKILKNLTGKEIINYKFVVHHPEADFETWLDECWQQFGLQYLTLSIYSGLLRQLATDFRLDRSFKYAFRY